MQVYMVSKNVTSLKKIWYATAVAAAARRQTATITAAASTGAACTAAAQRLRYVSVPVVTYVTTAAAAA